MRTITEPHCQQCGNTDPDEVEGSYSGCCNERVIAPFPDESPRCDPRECTHP